MEQYILQGPTLIVRQTHLTREDPRFDKACLELLKKPGNVLTIDMSSVKIITSTFIGIVAVTYLDAEKQRKKLIIKAPTRVLDVFRLAGFEGRIDLIEVPYTPV